MKYLKDTLIVATVVLVGIIAVMGGHFSDAATNKGAWTFWAVAQPVAAIALILAWVYAWITQKKEK